MIRAPAQRLNVSLLIATGFMSNSEYVLNRLSRRCDRSHRHIALVGGRAKRAEVYPEQLCREILIGLLDQMKQDKRINPGQLGSLLAT